MSCTEVFVTIVHGLCAGRLSHHARRLLAPDAHAVWTGHEPRHPGARGNHKVFTYLPASNRTQDYVFFTTVFVINCASKSNAIQ